MLIFYFVVLTSDVRIVNRGDGPRVETRSRSKGLAGGPTVPETLQVCRVVIRSFDIH